MSDVAGDVAADVAAVAAFVAADTTDVLAADTTDVLSAAKAASGGCCPANTCFLRVKTGLRKIAFISCGENCWRLCLPEAQVSWPQSHAQQRQGITQNMVL